MGFEFKDFDRIIGEEIDLLIDQKVPGNETKKRVPAYMYHIVLHNSSAKVGMIMFELVYG